MSEQVVEPREMTKDQLKLLALKQRIGQITSDYEDRMADMRAEWTQAEGAFQNALRQQESELERLQEQLRKYQDAEANQKTPGDSKSTE